MNKQIEKLVGKAWEQANKEVSDDDWYTWVHDEIFQTKLVELVVKECAQVCLSQRNPSNLNYKPSEKFAQALKQHFGVK